MLCRQLLVRTCCFFLIIFPFVSACSAEPDGAEDALSREDVDEVEPFQAGVNDERTVSTLITFVLDPQMLLQAEQVWQLQAQAMTFQARQKNEAEDIYVSGTYRTAQDWILIGNDQEDQSFQVINDGESVILEYSQHRQLIDEQEVEYLLPFPHLLIIEDLLQQEAYHWLALTSDQQGWNVQIRSGIDPLFASFLDVIQLGEAQFSGDQYALEYQLYFRGFDFSTLLLDRLEFRLLKNEVSLENVEFMLHRPLGIEEARGSSDDTLDQMDG